MSDYHKRYNVCTGWASHYTDDPAKALAVMQSALDRGEDPAKVWCAEGYADEKYDYPREGVTMVTRRTIGPVTMDQLRHRVTEREYAEQRAEVARMAADNRRALSAH